MQMTRLIHPRQADSEAIVEEQAEPEAVVEEPQTVPSQMIVERESINKEANNAETTMFGEDKLVLKDNL